MTDVSNVTQSNPEPPLGNDPSTRTPAGEIRNQATAPLTQPSATTSSTTEPKPNEPEPPKTPASGAPERYELKSAQGQPALDPRTVEEATPIFRELGLDNAQAQRLVDFYNKQITKATGPEANKAILDARNAQFMEQLQRDPEIGGKLPQVKADIGRAMDALGKPELKAEFQKAMDASPEGNNPLFVKMFHALAEKVIEGKPTSGGGPSPHGQTAGGVAERPSIANAMWPNLVQNATRQ